MFFYDLNIRSLRKAEEGIIILEVENIFFCLPLQIFSIPSQ